MELRELSAHHGHYAGDLQIFAAGLEWAREQGIELLIKKLSRRFIACNRWREGLLDLARRSNAVTFSSYTTSYHYGFRTECLGLYVPAWAQIPELKREATPGRRIFVEKFLHNRARLLAERWLSRSGAPRIRSGATSRGTPAGRRCTRPPRQRRKDSSGTTPTPPNSTPPPPAPSAFPTRRRISGWSGNRERRSHERSDFQPLPGKVQAT